MVKKLNAKSAAILGLFIVSLVMIISVSFAWYIYEGEKGESFKISGNTATGGPKITYTENKSGISLAKTYPMSDSMGITTDPYIYTVRNDNEVPIKITVLFEVMANSTLDNSLVKYSLDSNINSFKDKTRRKPARSEFKDAYVIDTYTLAAGESKSSSLRLWVSEEGTVETAANKSWEGRITADPEFID